jgi:hypothetical protein
MVFTPKYSGCCVFFFKQLWVLLKMGGAQESKLFRNHDCGYLFGTFSFKTIPSGKPGKQ